MKEYLIWAAEILERKYKWDFENAMYWLTHASYIPEEVSLKNYISKEINKK